MKSFILGYKNNETLEFPFGSDTNTTELHIFGEKICGENIPKDPSCIVRTMGCVSLLLTVVNIICILVFGTLVLWLKEVTPEKLPQSYAYFWKRDVKNHRKLGQPNVEVNQYIKKQAREQLGLEISEDNSLQEKFSQTVVRKITQDPDYKRISDLQFSTFNINNLNPTDSFAVDIPSANDATNYPISQNLGGFVTSNVKDDEQSTESTECASTAIDLKLYHQAELLIRNSYANRSLRQLRDGTIGKNLKNNDNEPKTAPIMCDNSPPRFNV